MILALTWLASFIASMTWWRLPLDHDDQALFRLGSAILRHGGQLYRDIWDVKQPGIYWFYEVAERLFGTGTVFGGVHVLASIWLATAAVVVAWLLRTSFPRSRAWILAPVLTLGAYIFRVNVFSFAQVESLIVLPILGVLACIASGAVSGVDKKLCYFLAGLLAAATAVFKLILIAIPFAMIAVGLLGLALRTHVSATGDSSPASTNRRLAASCLLASAAGGSVVLIAVVLPFVLTDRLDVFLWTQFVFPGEAIQIAELAPPRKLLVSGGYLFTTVVLFLPAAAVGILRLERSSSAFARSVGHSCVSWVVVGLAAIIAQRFSWHAYHFTMLIWPIGILAAAGAAIESSQSMEAPPGQRIRVWRAATLLVIIGVLVNGARFTWHQIHPFMPSVDSRHYLDAQPELRARITGEQCRSAIVFGNPALLHAASLVPVSRLTGQLAVILLPSQWEELARTMRERRPQFVYISRELHPVLRMRASDLDLWISENYESVGADTHEGTWLSYRGGRTAQDCQVQVPLTSADLRSSKHRDDRSMVRMV